MDHGNFLREYLWKEKVRNVEVLHSHGLQHCKATEIPIMILAFQLIEHTAFEVRLSSVGHCVGRVHWINIFLNK